MTIDRIGRRVRAARRRVAAGAIMLLVPLLWGCGDLTAGGLSEATVVVASDGEEAQGASAPAPTAPAAVPGSGSGSGPETAGGALQPGGRVHAVLEVAVRSPEGEWIVLTDDLEEANLELDGGSEAELATRSLDPGLYPEVRLRFTEVEARLEGGPDLPDVVSVDFGEPGELEVVEPVELDLPAGESADIVLDLNTTEWLAAAAPALPRVAAARFREALRVRIRPGS